jgi:pyruvate dehydrogenase E1 component alpha subunit/2-oxoisovalerate dehydrogenase E1 component alpha subunit
VSESATDSLLGVLRDDGRTDPATDPFLAPETLLALYREMRRIRALDTALVALQQRGEIGFYSASFGQEAVAIGAAFALEPSDWVFPALREGAILLARGFPLASYLGQIFGTVDDLQKGRQMPCHVSSRAHNVASSSGVIGTQLPQAVGAAWAARKRGARTISVGFIGEGGTSTGDFHAAMNFAGVFRAPCVIICQNNQWALGTPSTRQTSSASFAIKARAYGMPGLRVDGNDVLAVYRAVSNARVRAVAGAGPTFLECVTARTGVDSTSELVLADAEVGKGDARDPIARLRRHLSYLELIDDASDESLGRELANTVSVAITAAKNRPLPDRSTLTDDVYAERPWHLVEQDRELATPGEKARLSG